MTKKDYKEEPKFKKLKLLHDDATELLKKIEPQYKKWKFDQGIKGLERLIKAVKSEISFFKSLMEKVEHCKDIDIVKKEHINTTNLYRYVKIVEFLEGGESGITHILCPKKYMKFDDNNRKFKYSTTIDVIAGHGIRWYKMKSQQPEVLENIYYGQGTPKDKPVDEMAKHMVGCSKSFPVRFEFPQCIMVFLCGVTKEISDILTSIGIDVLVSPSLPLTPHDDLIIEKSITLKQLPPESKKVNLCISTLLSIISDMTNTPQNVNVFSHTPVLQSQVKEELENPSLPTILDFLKDKTDIYITQAARDKFDNVLHEIAGDEEKARAKLFFKTHADKIKFVPNDPSPRFKKLRLTKRIQQKHIDIFGTGESLKAITMTSNKRFLSHAREQGVKRLITYIHPSRALTEKRRKKWESENGI
mmetsp:Transcript_3500/g.5143  ORF Transcript_3500/g.5143 Transcript_3500/m.5143 type:complete len:416 (-) Transcript_3500:84-1331(-)